MPAVLEFGAVPDCSDDGGRRLGPDALDLGNPPTGLRGAKDAVNLVVEPADPVIEVLEEVPELSDRLARDGREHIAGVVEDPRDHGPRPGDVDAEHDAAIEEDAPHLGDERGAVVDEALPRS